MAVPTVPGAPPVGGDGIIRTYVIQLDGENYEVKADDFLVEGLTASPGVRATFTIKTKKVAVLSGFRVSVFLKEGS